MFLQLLNEWAVAFDLPILDWIQANMANPFLDKIMPIITVLGDAGIFWMIVAAILAITKKYRKLGFGMAIAMALGLVVCNMILKPTVGRIRPYDFQETLGITINLLIEKQHDFSFPSGHTIASFEACTVLMLGSRKLGIPATLLAILIAFSRLYLYVHYPTDVIASVILGTLFGIIGYLVTHKINFSRNGKYLKK
jgi:undecaprenyl-diphosphatase